MSETIAGRVACSLREIALGIQQTIREQHAERIWIRAEMNKLNIYPHSGHCYPELVEKQDGKVVAQMRANLWKDDYLRINRTFLEVLKEPLRDGIAILIHAAVTFDPVYGLALRIYEIDPSFSLGELEREKQATIAALQKEGIFGRNRTTVLPFLPQRIAIISVETSKGYSDFMKVIGANPWGYAFFHMLFPALLQGDQAAQQIIAQLRRIRSAVRHFDAVAIIRGGGGDVGLSCYNDLSLAREVALFPIPVLTGIGHSTNETVTEMVAFRNAITPTELADFLIQRFHNFAVPLKEMERSIAERTLRLLADTRTLLMNSARYFRAVAERMLADHAARDLLTALERAARQRIAGEQKEIALLQSKVGLLDPVNVLKRGYSITMKEGKPLTKDQQVAAGDEIETQLYRGRIRSIVK
jgi:exodeoxyribonuclease VII large subunit